LGRRHERGRCVDHAVLLSDLALLIDAGPDSGEVPTADGRWLGDEIVTATSRGPVKAQREAAVKRQAAQRAAS
jgi:hypothetical protein